MGADHDAMEAAAQATLDHRYVACCGDCGTRLYCPLDDHDDGTHAVHGRAQCDVHGLARQVLTLAAALRTERAAREAAEAQHAALAGAVRADTLREARAAVIARQDAVDAEAERAGMLPSIYGRLITQDNVRALDALLAGAPSGYVPARVVREYLAAEETMRLVAADDHRRDTYHEWAKRHGAAMDAVDAARTALDAALAAATTTPTEGHG